ncbi:Spy/CpxP family protein refolding chaperone [Psychroserpens ponticola]|uniref:Periplasmic heavy metal sensor n=1 Tax=Psychroserpens ponticola TaxID=2932268 RepID=A0ABY7RU61_9FLAO|nr:hypothetical protein [Psychroserpens ponticola]WCO00653.1 hypothetical protein MUN68_011305 [Psychroserpens ponticola]
MKKNKLLYILLVFLVVVNGFFLFNYLGKPNFKRPSGKQDGFIARELNFDEIQKQKFEALKAAHFKRIEVVLDEERKLKDDLFDRISNETINTFQIDSITNQIGKLAKLKDLETFNHFRDIQNICNESQKNQFEQILRHALHGKGKNGQGPPSNRGREGDMPPPPPKH